MKVNSNWIEHPNVIFETLKVVQKSIMEILENIGTDNYFLDRPPIMQK
jgi:hypothetical protein